MTTEDKENIRREWGENFYMSPGTNKRKGIITLFSKEIEPESVSLLFVSDRILITAFCLNDSNFAVINIYSPWDINEKFIFMKNLNYTIKSVCQKHCIENIILLGDFNTVQSNELDVISGMPHPIKIVDSLNHLINDLQLNDIWRQSNGNKKMFTWSCNTPFIARRLDYIFISMDIIPFCKNCDIQNIGFSDHKGVTLSLDFSTFERGSDIYKFNTKLLYNTHFVKEVKKDISRITYLKLSPHDTW